MSSNIKIIFQLRMLEYILVYNLKRGLPLSLQLLRMSSSSSQSEISIVSILAFFLILALAFSALPLNLHLVHCLKHSFFEFVANISIDISFLHLLHTLFIPSIDTSITNYPFITLCTRFRSYVLLTSIEVNKIYHTSFHSKTHT
jgi:hypothetical protein